MPSTSLPAAVRAHKALVRQIADFDESLENVEDFAQLIRTDGVRASLRKEAAVLRKRMEGALGDKDLAAVAKALPTLAKDAAKLVDKAGDANSKDLYERATTLLNKARGLLAQAMVDVGRIEPPSLRAPLQREQAALRKALDAVEAEGAATPGTVDTLEKLIPRIELLLQRLDPVRKAGDWMRANYLPLLSRVEASIKRVVAERCRKSLLAELDFIEVDTDTALGKGDIKAVQARSVPRLQRIERLAVRIAAASPALDRELARLARLAGGGAQPVLAKRLKAMIQAKGATWPAGADADAIETALSAYEAELARLSAEMDKGATAKAPAKA